MIEAKEGSFNWYQYHSGDFVQALARAIILADSENKRRLRSCYPQMVAAHEMKDHDESPLKFEPHYQGREFFKGEPLNREVDDG